MLIASPGDVETAYHRRAGTGALARLALGVSRNMDGIRRPGAVAVLRDVLGAGDATGDQVPQADIGQVLVRHRDVRALGDALLLTPLLAELATVFPGATVDVMCGGGGDSEPGRVRQRPLRSDAPGVGHRCATVGLFSVTEAEDWGPFDPGMPALTPSDDTPAGIARWAVSRVQQVRASGGSA